MATRNTKVFEVDPGSLGRSIAKAGLSKAAEARIARLARKSLERTLRALIEDVFTRGPIAKRTWNAYQTMRGGIRVYGSNFNNLRAHIIGPGYIAALETGATITPKRTKYLAIPLRAALRPDGSPKLPGPRSWKNIKKTWVYTSKKTGKKYIVYKNSRTDWTFLYVLLDEVEMPRLQMLAKAWARNRADFVGDYGQLVMQEMAKVDLHRMSRIARKK